MPSDAISIRQRLDKHRQVVSSDIVFINLLKANLIYTKTSLQSSLRGSCSAECTIALKAYSSLCALLRVILLSQELS